MRGFYKTPPKTIIVTKGFGVQGQGSGVEKKKNVAGQRRQDY